MTALVPGQTVTVDALGAIYATDRARSASGIQTVYRHKEPKPLRKVRVVNGDLKVVKTPAPFEGAERTECGMDFSGALFGLEYQDRPVWRIEMLGDVWILTDEDAHRVSRDAELLVTAPALPFGFWNGG